MAQELSNWYEKNLLTDFFGEVGEVGGQGSQGSHVGEVGGQEYLASNEAEEDNRKSKQLTKKIQSYIVKKNIKISAIMAMDKNSLIGAMKDGKHYLPWKIKNELKWFKRCTLYKPVIMGGITFHSLPFFLPLRDNIILTRSYWQKNQKEKFLQKPYPKAKFNHVFAKNVNQSLLYSFHSIANNLANQENEVIIMGGGQIYEAFRSFINCYYITHIEHEFSGSVFFPHKDYLQFAKQEVLHEASKSNDDYIYKIIKYIR